MSAALKVTRGYLQRRVLVLPEAGPFLLGRSLEANLILYGDSVADRHALLVPDEAAGVHRLVPVSGRLPTRLSGKTLRRPVVLADGDRIEIGGHEFVYAARSSREEITAAAAERRCPACHEPIGPEGRDASLEGLRIGGEVVCPRCVDHRLHVDRDLESYRILRKIATNDDEVTYLAVDRETDVRLAIRILKADRQADLVVLRRFLIRALVGLVLDHPNYLEAHGIRSSNGITYVVLDHMEHTAKLERYVREKAPVSPYEALAVANQLAEILRHARERRIVVAKRKRSGVLVDRRRRWVKVLAFDVTRDLERQVAQTAAFRDLVAQSGRDPAEVDALGWPEPKTPEEARLMKLASEYAETYSIGRILFHLLAGRPFTPKVVNDVKAAQGSAARGQRGKGRLAALPRPVLDLLAAVLVPGRPAQVKTLAGLTSATKAAYEALPPEPEPPDPESEEEADEEADELLDPDEFV